MSKLRAIAGGRKQVSQQAVAALAHLLKRAQEGEFQSFVMLTDNGGDVQLMQSGPVHVPSMHFGMGLWQTSQAINVLQGGDHDVPDDPKPTG